MINNSKTIMKTGRLRLRVNANFSNLKGMVSCRRLMMMMTTTSPNIWIKDIIRDLKLLRWREVGLIREESVEAQPWTVLELGLLNSRLSICDKVHHLCLLRLPLSPIMFLSIRPILLQDSSHLLQSLDSPKLRWKIEVIINWIMTSIWISWKERSSLSNHPTNIKERSNSNHRTNFKIKVKSISSHHNSRTICSSISSLRVNWMMKTLWKSTMT